jgi:hypothetical protein
MSVTSVLKQIALSAYNWAKTAVAASKPDAAPSTGAGAGAAAVTPDPEPVEPATMARPSPTAAKRRPGIRDEVLEAVRAAGKDGATRAELLKTLSVKGDPSGERAVSNALSALKKRGALLHEGNKYLAA